MKERHRGGPSRHSTRPTGPSSHHGDDRGRAHHHHHHGRSGGRLFDYGELRLLILAMIAEQPRHGYELIKLIEERFGGSYTPSPGVIYPTLAWLEDMGYATVETEDGGRKRYSIGREGSAHLDANRAAVKDLLSRTASDQTRGGGQVPAAILRAMENLKLALRLRLKEGALNKTAAEEMAAAIDAAAQAVERS